MGLTRWGVTSLQGALDCAGNVCVGAVRLQGSCAGMTGFRCSWALRRRVGASYR
jgi:hypothetical protein